MKRHQRTVGKSDDWITPRWILDPLGEFDLDPCAPDVMPWKTAHQYFTKAVDGLNREWRGRVWLNPPFNRYQRPQWMRRMADHGNGIMLVPAACETQAFHDYVWNRADGILMLSVRPHFCDIHGIAAKANSGCTICLVAYGRRNARILKKSGLGVFLKQVGKL